MWAAGGGWERRKPASTEARRQKSSSDAVPRPPAAPPRRSGQRPTPAWRLTLRWQQCAQGGRTHTRTQAAAAAAHGRQRRASPGARAAARCAALISERGCSALDGRRERLNARGSSSLCGRCGAPACSAQRALTSVSASTVMRACCMLPRRALRCLMCAAAPLASSPAGSRIRSLLFAACTPPPPCILLLSYRGAAECCWVHGHSMCDIRALLTGGGCSRQHERRRLGKAQGKRGHGGPAQGGEGSQEEGGILFLCG